jgi:hypothetical protein
MLELLALIEIGNLQGGLSEYRLIAQLSLRCDDETHILWALTCAIPVLIIVGYFFPLALTQILHKK